MRRVSSAAGTVRLDGSTRRRRRDCGLAAPSSRCGTIRRGPSRHRSTDGARVPAPRSWSAAARAATSPTQSSRRRTSTAAARRRSARILRALPVPDTVAFFAEHRRAAARRAGGKLFPDSNRSRDVLDALLRELDRLGGSTCAPSTASPPSAPRRRLRASTRRAGALRAGASCSPRAVCRCPRPAATAPASRSRARLGHTIVPTTPALAPLLLDDGTPLQRRRSAASPLPVRLELAVDGADRDAHFGLDAVDALRRQRPRRAGPVAALAPRARSTARAGGDRQPLPGRHLRDASDARVAGAGRGGSRAPRFRPRSRPCCRRRWRRSCSTGTGIAAVPHPRRPDPRGPPPRSCTRCCEWPLPVTGSRGYDYAEATAGGVDLSEIDPSTMESRRCPGLFLVGEMLDVDGRIGGFNFQWAWSSAMAGGRALGRRSAANRRAAP